jgi:GTPase
MKKCGYIALLGRPNAGKSTLLNSCIGTKLAVVSSKPQTTRNKILGIALHDQTQILFLDTPGIHDSKSFFQINKAMNKLAWSVLEDANVVCYLISSQAGWHDEDFKYISGVLERTSSPVLIFVSQSDRIKKDEFFNLNLKLKTEVQNIVDAARQKFPEKNIAVEILNPISAKRPEEISNLKAYVAKMLPNSEWFYPEDDLTDMPQKFVCAEFIREQIFRNFSAELPYSTAVKVDLFEKKESIINIVATIAVQRESQKKMVIGAGGSAIKNIGIAARAELERHLDSKVFLELFVKVEKNWNDDLRLMSEYSSINEKDFIK